VELSTCACMKSFETVRRPSKVLTSVWMGMFVSVPLQVHEQCIKCFKDLQKYLGIFEGAYKFWKYSEGFVGVYECLLT
jgi:hypothetical protein